MVFQFHQSAKCIQTSVQGYLEANSHSETGWNTLSPNGYSGIFFNFGNRGKLHLKEELDARMISVFGQIDRAFRVTYQPGFYSLGVLFKPAALSRFLRVNMAEFTNTAFDGTLLRPDLRILHEKLEVCQTSSQRIELLNQYFSRVLTTISDTRSIADHALHILQHDCTVSIEQLADRLQMSQRYIEMHFRKTIGLSPKTYSIILRFKRMERQLKKMQSVSLLDTDHENEYYDQNHFIKDFKRFTGYTPSRYLVQDISMLRSYLTS